MPTPQWIKKLGGHAGELFVCAELSKRGIPNALLPENFTDDDILVGDKTATHVGFVQVKACHPDRAASFRLSEANESWSSADPNQFCAFVWLGRPATFDAPRYFLATKREVGEACHQHSAHGHASNKERRFHMPGVKAPLSDILPAKWENRWSLFERFQPP